MCWYSPVVLPCSCRTSRYRLYKYCQRAAYSNCARVWIDSESYTAVWCHRCTVKAERRNQNRAASERHHQRQRERRWEEDERQRAREEEQLQEQNHQREYYRREEARRREEQVRREEQLHREERLRQEEQVRREEQIRHEERLRQEEQRRHEEEQLRRAERLRHENQLRHEEHLQHGERLRGQERLRRDLQRSEERQRRREDQKLREDRRRYEHRQWQEKHGHRRQGELRRAPKQNRQVHRAGRKADTAAKRIPGRTRVYDGRLSDRFDNPPAWRAGQTRVHEDTEYLRASRQVRFSETQDQVEQPVAPPTDGSHSWTNDFVEDWLGEQGTPADSPLQTEGTKGADFHGKSGIRVSEIPRSERTRAQGSRNAEHVSKNSSRTSPAGTGSSSDTIQMPQGSGDASANKSTSSSSSSSHASKKTLSTSRSSA